MASGLGADWPVSAWVHDFHPNLPGVHACEVDKDGGGGGAVDESEWEGLALAAGLEATFTGDECADAWDQVWPLVGSYGFFLIQGVGCILSQGGFTRGASSQVWGKGPPGG